MKKLLLGILISLFMVTIAYGECVQTIQAKNNLNVMKFAWTTVATGSFTTTTSNMPVDGYIVMIETVPSSTAAPTDDYDITLNNDDGYEVTGGNLANRDTANTEVVMPLLNSEIVRFPNFGALTLAITNAGANKSGVVNVYYEWNR